MTDKGYRLELVAFLLLFAMGIVAGFAILYFLSPMLAVVAGVVGIILLGVPAIIMAMSGSIEKIPENSRSGW